MTALEILSSAPEPHVKFVSTAVNSTFYTKEADLIAKMFPRKIEFGLLTSLMNATNDVGTHSIFINYAYHHLHLTIEQILLLTAFIGTKSSNSVERSRGVLNRLQLP